MGALTLAVMNTELLRRLTNLDTTSANSALNRAIRFINRQGSFTFQLADKTTLSVTSTGIVNSPADLDPGKAIYLENPNGSPIQRIAVSDVWAAQNYNTYADAGFTGYVLIAASAPPHQIRFFPTLTVTKVVTLIYHKIIATITVGVTNLPSDFDDLVVDLAEAEERRIYDIGDAWPKLMERSMEQIKALLEGYRTQKVTAGTDTENAALVQAKTQVGKG